MREVVLVVASLYKTGRLIDFTALYKKLKQFEDTAPEMVKSVTFVVTEDCSLRCTYCYEKHKNPENRMSLETAKKAIDLLFEEDLKNSELINENNAQAVILDFIGGEPLLEIELISNVVDYFLFKAIELDHRWQTEYMINICSNGTHYFKPKVQEFIEEFRNRLSLTITIDGNKELHDACRVTPTGLPSFDIADRAYKDCINRGLTNGTKMTIAPANLPFLSKALIDLAGYEKITEIPANPVFEEDWSFENATLYYNELKKFGQWIIDNEWYEKHTTSLFTEFTMENGWELADDQNYCGGNGKMLAFAPNGDAYPCLRYLPFALQNKDSRRKMLLGSVDSGLLNDDYTKETISCLGCVGKKSQSTQKCLECPIQQGCAWCTAWNYDYYGTPNKRFTGICNMHKARTMANYWYWNTLYHKLGLEKRAEVKIPRDWALEIIPEEEFELLLELSK